jgi:hypothetical protein
MKSDNPIRAGQPDDQQRAERRENQDVHPGLRWLLRRCAENSQHKVNNRIDRKHDGNHRQREQHDHSPRLLAGQLLVLEEVQCRRPNDPA